MSRSQIFKIVALVFVLSILTSVTYGYDDGFGQARKTEGKYFAIYYAPQLDEFSLSQQLNIGVTDKILAGGSAARTPSSARLSDMVDTLFLRICDLLDMHLYSYRGNIKICRDYNQLNQIYRNLFNADLKGTRSFYTYELNTIYISPESFQLGILGHEIAHAIISHYFVVQPPVKVAEVLAGYVEYQLRKATIK